jgi:putative membrane protein
MTEILGNFVAKHLISERINRFWITFYTVGIIGFSIPYTQEVFRKLIGFSILLCAVLLLWFHKTWNNRFILASFLILAGGFFIESIGVNTGHIFGEYRYGESLNPQILKTPLLIGVNWWLLIYIVWQLVSQIRTASIARLLFGSIIMVGYDLFLESFAVATDMWSWESGFIPMQNYLAWFIISFIFLSIFKLAKIKYNNPVALKLLAVQIAFFVLLNTINQISNL